jgi:prepilin-type N-terminal cleavage/methylation domain-containing protein
MLKNSKKAQRKTQRKAFSLLELSVVIVIIGILITGVMKGSSLVSASRLNAARSLTARSPVGEINGLAAWYETTSLQSFGRRNPQVSSAIAASISTIQLAESNKIEIWRDIGPKCINNYTIVNTDIAASSVTSDDYADTCNALSQIVANRPYYSLSGINNLPSVRFESGNSLLLNAFKDGDIAAATKFVVFSVDSKPTTNDTATILDNDLSLSTPTSQRIFISPANISINNGDSSNSNITTSYTIKNTYILAVIFNGANSYHKINNNAISSAINPGSNTARGLTLGGANFVGKISEVIVFNRMLKESEMTEIFNYLGKKYKVQVL